MFQGSAVASAIRRRNVWSAGRAAQVDRRLYMSGLSPTLSQRLRKNDR